MTTERSNATVNSTPTRPDASAPTPLHVNDDINLPDDVATHVPIAVVNKGLPGPGILAYIAASKYAD